VIRAVLFALVFGLAASTPGAAAPLTQNGLIAFASDRSENLEKSEVYIVGADGKNRMNVSRGTTTPEDEDPHPTWSPDSRRLAFSGDEALVVVAPDGSSRELWNEGDLRDTHDRPNWSPDGRDIAVAGVSLVSTSTHRVRHLTSGGIADGEAMWSHDGTRLAFLRFEVEGDFPALYVIRRDGTGLRRLARRVTCCVSWSPTGYSLLFGDQTGALIIIDARTGRRRHLSLGRRQVASDVDAVWAPRGKWIAVPTGRGLYLVTPNGRERRRISSLVGTPAWSPTGKAVAVPSRGDIYVISVETGRRRRVVRGRCREEVTGMSWAADGEHIAFVSSMSGENDTEIFTMRDDGSRLNRLTHNCSRYEREPAWSPNGRRIAYAMDDIFVMRADGSHKARLTRGKALDSSPSWSPEGGTIVFSRFVVRRGGSQPLHRGHGLKAEAENADGVAWEQRRSCLGAARWSDRVRQHSARAITPDLRHARRRDGRYRHHCGSRLGKRARMVLRRDSSGVRSGLRHLDDECRRYDPRPSDEIQRLHGGGASGMVTGRNENRVRARHRLWARNPVRVVRDPV
jgi:Tol biopolymer transport system component